MQNIMRHPSNIRPVEITQNLMQGIRSNTGDGYDRTTDAIDSSQLQAYAHHSPWRGPQLCRDHPRVDKATSSTRDRDSTSTHRTGTGAPPLDSQYKLLRPRPLHRGQARNDPNSAAASETVRNLKQSTANHPSDNATLGVTEIILQNIINGPKHADA